MFERPNRAFLLRRAHQEREIANNCEDSTAAIAHLRMAEEYDRRAEALTADDSDGSGVRDT